jgi:hypothetical protein
MVLPNSIFLKECLAAGNTVLDAYTSKGLSIAELLKRAPEIKAMANRCKEETLYDSIVKEHVDATLATILQEGAIAEALPFMVEGFIKKVSEIQNDTDLTQAAFYYFPIISFLIEANINEVSKMNLSIPRP